MCDSDGLRASKTVNGEEHRYWYQDGRLIYEERDDGRQFCYSYDGYGNLSCIRYYYNGNSYAYYVQTNARGDIEAMYGGDGIVRVRYIYDSWGNTLSVQDANGKEITDPNHIGNLNPFRYRGYYLDSETGLYYLQSRYYDPQTCRFVNADAVVSAVGSSIQGYNLFAYCMNNPVNMTDTTGNWPQFIENVVNWINDKIIQPVKRFVAGMVKDIKNFDINNQSEKKALESNYVAGYKGKLVIRIEGNRSGSFGAIFLTRETNSRDNPEDVLRHEYGHTKQLQQLGPIKYAIAIGLPSALEMGGGDYYSRPWEITADIYGGVQSRYHTRGDIENGFLYLEIYNNDVRPPVVMIFIE